MEPQMYLCDQQTSAALHSVASLIYDTALYVKARTIIRSVWKWDAEEYGKKPSKSCWL